jgi:hypothetical protein
MFFPLLQHSVRRVSRPGTRMTSQRVLSLQGLAIQAEAGPSLLSSIQVIAQVLTRTRTGRARKRHRDAMASVTRKRRGVMPCLHCRQRERLRPRSYVNEAAEDYLN